MTLLEHLHLERPLPDGSLSPASLLAFVLACAGVPTSVRLRGYEPAPAAEAEAPILLLRAALPLADLLPVLHRFTRSIDECWLLVAAEEDAPAYRERLCIDSAAGGIHIERAFPRRRSGDSRRILGVLARPAPAWRSDPACWSVFRLLRSCIRSGDVPQRHYFHRTLPHDAPAIIADALRHLTPDECRSLAENLGYEDRGELVFAAPSARIHPSACLRGPLFIGPGVVLGPDDIHVGPAWITGRPTAITLAARPYAPAIIDPRYFAGPGTLPKPGYDLAKRIFDIVFASASLAVLAPIMIVSALLVKLYDFGPIFFTHEREGLHGKPFGCIKFRTMVRDAEALKAKLQAANQVDGPQFKMAKDPRITPLGRFLRRANVDELPQLFNVLKGEMSIVGPRPSPFKENQLCPPWREARLSVKPGITGLWQVSRSHERGAADFQEWIFYDTQYVDRRGFFLDIKIILLTVKEILGKGQ